MLRSRMRRSLILITLAVCVLALGAIWWLVGESGKDTQARYCWGALSSGEIAADFQSGEVEIKSEENTLVTSAPQDCILLGDDARIAEYEVSTGPRLWLYGDRNLVDRSDLYAYRSPIGSDLSGWINPTGGAVWLPPACSTEFGEVDEPVVVSLSVLNESFKKMGSETERRSKVRSMLMKVAQEVARKSDCSDTKFENPDFNRTEIEKSTVSGSRVCGVEGFSVLSDGDVSGEIRQYVGGSQADSWSCLLEHEGKSESAKMTAFTSTRQKEIIEDFRIRNGGERVDLPGWDAPGFWRESEWGLVLLECDSGPLLAGMEHPYRDKKSIDAARKKLKSPQEMFESYVSLVAERESCKSVKSE